MTKLNYALVPMHIRDLLSSNIVNLDGITLASSATLRNLDIIFDQELSFNSHIFRFQGLPSFTSITLLKYGTSCLNKMQKKHVHPFVISRLDYCRTNIRVHISPVLASLYWLPLKFRIELKILVLTYKAIHSQTPSNL